MPTLSRRIAATFQSGRDPDQDQIVEWLKTLPVSDKGNVERSVMKYHITRALLLYIQTGSMSKSQSIPHALVTVQPSITQAPPINVSPVEKEMKPIIEPPVHVDTPVVSKPKGAGSLLRNKIAKSMSTGG